MQSLVLDALVTEDILEARIPRPTNMENKQ